jgi:hypothetical protein
LTSSSETTSIAVQRVFDQLEGDRRSLRPYLEDREAGARLRLGARSEAPSGQLGQSLPDILAFCRSQTSRRLKHVVVDFQCSAHHNIMTS